MGRRKIEIKAIKDDRNRSVTFLKRKGGLFKKAHELSVLCSVDVAVFIFGNNKKLYEYSSADMRDLIGRYQFHGGPNEHKGPSDFNGGNDDDDEEGDATPPHAADSMDSQMMPPQFHGQQPPFPQIRHHTPSASPPMISGGGSFPGHHIQRGHTPQPTVGSRPTSRNDTRRLGPNMVSQQQVGPQGAQHPGITYMPTPPIYNPPPNQSNLMPQPSPPYSYPPPQNQMQQPPYMEDRMPSVPPGYAPHPPQGITVTTRAEPSPQPRNQQLPHPPVPHISPPPPQPERRPQDPQPPPPVEPKGLHERLSTDPAIKKLPQRKSHSIFTPIEENRSILSQHLASFAGEPQSIKSESMNAAAAANRSQSLDMTSGKRSGSKPSPALSQKSNPQSTANKSRTQSVSSVPETTFTPPSRSNSLKIGGPAGSTRPGAPQLTIQIPDGASDAGTPTGESNSPRNPVDTAAAPHRHNSSMVLPPPSPSASALLSAGATGPPNPFARPPPQERVNGGDTPVSALPSRFLNNEFLPSPSSFYQDWNFRGGDSNTLPSPLNFATPVVGMGPSFLRDDGGSHGGAEGNNPSGLHPSASAPAKRKSPEFTPGSRGDGPDTAADAKRVKVE